MFKVQFRKFRCAFQFGMAGLMCAAVPTVAQAQGALTDVERAAVLALVEQLPTVEFRRELRVGGEPSNVHVVANFNDSKEDALAAVFKSYGSVPANTQILLSYYAGNHQTSALYYCPASDQPCSGDTIQAVTDFDPDQAWQIKDTRGGMIFPPSGGGSRLEVNIPTDRKGRLAAVFSHSNGAAQNDLRSICMGLKFYPKGFFGEKDPVGQGDYCYNFALGVFTADAIENTYGYILNDADRAQVRSDAKAVLGIDIATD